MTPTPESLRLTADAIKAYADGKPVQQRLLNASTGSIREWHPLEGDIAGFTNGWEYRPAPEPQLRDWSKPEDVPMPVCWLRPHSAVSSCWLVVGIKAEGVLVNGFSQIGWVDWIEIKAMRSEFSTDGKTWKPCKVEEVAP